MPCHRWIRTLLPLGTALLLVAAALLPAGCDEGNATPADGGDAADDAGADVTADTGPDPLQCDPRAAALPLDEIPAAGEAVAGKVEDAAALIGTVRPMAQVGKAWKLANHDVAFVVQGNEAHVGYDIYGGSLLDGDVQRPAGEEGNDTFFEQFPIVGYKVPTAASIGVLCDGNDGRAAVLRIEGVDAPSLLISEVDALTPMPLNFRIVTDYILEPDTNVLRIRTTATNNGARTWSSVGMGDLLFFGSTNTVFSPEVGFGNYASAHDTLLATVADPEQPRHGVSYAFASLHGPLSVPIGDNGASGALGNTVHTLVRGASTVFERVLAVGRDMSAAVEPVREALGLDSAVVTGTVDDADGPVAGASVVALSGPGAATFAVGQAFSDADGSYRLVVPPGTYPLEAAKDGYLRGTGSTGTLAAGGAATVDLTLGDSGSLTVDVSDADGPCPAKVTLYGTDVEAPDDRIGPLHGERERMGAHRVLMVTPAETTFPVKPGHYHVVTSRGFEYGFDTQDIEVPAGGTATLTVVLTRLLDTTGWMAGDFHTHTYDSPDGQVSPCERVAEAAAEGVEAIVSTDHDGYTDDGPCVASQDLRPFLLSIVGVECSNMGTGGHRNAYPMPYDPDHFLDHWGPEYWVDTATESVLSAQQLNDKLHAESTNPIVQMNHPRSSDSYTNWTMFDPVTATVGRTGESLATGYDAMETSNSGGFPFDDVTLLSPEHDAELEALAAGASRGDVPLFADYRAFLRLGWHITAMGNSDVHGRNDGTGYSRSYLLVHQDDPATLTQDDVIAAVRAQRVVVSKGAFVDVTTNGVEAVGADDVVPMTGSDVVLHVEAQAIPDIDLSYLYVFANGRPLYLKREATDILAEDTAAGGGTLELALQPSDEVDDVLRLATDVRHHATVDTYYNVFVRGVGAMGPLPANDAFAYTNAIYVDVDGGGWGH